MVASIYEKTLAYRALLKSRTELSDSSVPVPNSYHSVTVGTERIYLPEDAVRLRDNLIVRLVQEYSESRRIDERTFEQDIEELLIGLLDESIAEDEIPERTRYLIDSYEHFGDSQIVFMPVFGMELAKSPMKLGKFVFFTITGDDYSQAIEDIVESCPGPIAKQIADNADAFLDSFIDNFRGPEWGRSAVYAYTIERGDSFSAHYHAYGGLDETLAALHLLDAAGSGNALGASLSSYEYSGDEDLWSFTISFDGKQWSSGQIGSGYATPVFGSDSLWTVSHKQRNALDEALRSIADEGDFYEPLSRGLTWFAVSHSTREPDVRFITLIAVVEAVLAEPLIKHGKGARYAKYLRGFVGRYFKEFKVDAVFRDCYSMRSAVLHGEIEKSVNWELLNKLERVVCRFLFELALLLNDVKSIDDCSK